MRLPRNTGAIVATISFGWEDEQFYRDWANWALIDAELNALKGPALQPMARQSDLANEALALFRELVLDEEYIERLKRHYRAFRAVVDGSPATDPATVEARKARRRKQLERRRRRGRNRGSDKDR